MIWSMARAIQLRIIYTDLLEYYYAIKWVDEAEDDDDDEWECDDNKDYEDDNGYRDDELEEYQEYGDEEE
jgi:hypothetical protein